MSYLLVAEPSALQIHVPSVTGMSEQHLRQPDSKSHSLVWIANWWDNTTFLGILRTGCLNHLMKQHFLSTEVSAPKELPGLNLLVICLLGPSFHVSKADLEIIQDRLCKEVALLHSNRCKSGVYNKAGRHTLNFKMYFRCTECEALSTPSALKCKNRARWSRQLQRTLQVPSVGKAAG